MLRHEVSRALKEPSELFLSSSTVAMGDEVRGGVQLVYGVGPVLRSTNHVSQKASRPGRVRA